MKDIPKGDLRQWQNESLFNLTCVITFYAHVELMKGILNCLSAQEIDKDFFEVILVEDKGGTPEGKKLASDFAHTINISYFTPPDNWGKMGYMRNYGLSKARGNIVLFLDDDTVILDNRFFSKLEKLFDDKTLMAVIPRGNPSFCIIEGQYSYHDPYFFTNRCMAYKRKCLIDLNGFDGSFVGQEDVELAMRFLAVGYKHIQTNTIQYFHPPLLVNNSRKPQAVGYSFARSGYSPFLKFLFCINGSRWIYRIIYPTPKNRNMAKFSFGFMIGFLKAFMAKEEMKYV